MGPRRSVILVDAGLLPPIRGALDVVGLVGEDSGEALLGLGDDRLALIDAIGADPLGVGRLGLGLREGLRRLALRWRRLGSRLGLADHRSFIRRPGDDRMLLGRLLLLVASRGAEQVGQRTFPHAGPLTTRHSSGPPWPAPDSSSRRSPSDRT